MDVEVRVLNAKIVIQETQPCYVKWMRGTQSINTTKKNISAEESKVTFEGKNARFKIQCSLYQNKETGEWREDKNSLTLVCGDDPVGKCDFNLPSYIGKEPKYETAMIVEADYQTTGEERVLKGNATLYPGA